MAEVRGADGGTAVGVTGSEGVYSELRSRRNYIIWGFICVIS